MLLLPHVTHEGADDVAAQAALLDALQDDQSGGCWSIGDLLPPAQIRYLTERADVIMTGRMHLSILGLLGGKAPIVLATQGKVRGLLEMFGISELSIEPDPGFGTLVLDAIDKLRIEADAYHNAVLNGLPLVVQASQENFKHLD